MEQRYLKLSGLLSRVIRARRRAAEEAFRDLDIHPGQHILLMHLSRAGRSASQAQVARQLDVSPAFIAKSFKGLEAAGYIAREDGRDIRRNEIALTEKGMAVVEESRRRFFALDEKCFAGLSENELEGLSGCLERMLANLNAGNEGENIE